MNNILSLLAYSTFAGFLFCSSCVSSKQSNPVDTSVEKQKTEGMVTPHPGKKKTAKVVGNSKRKNIEGPSTSENKDMFVSSPSTKVGQAFKTAYPSAREIIWTKKKASVQYQKTPTRNYKVDFFLDDIKQSVIYTENGEWIETSSQILADQLPQNIYNAIKREYPDAFIVSAKSIKNVNSQAAYSAVIRTATKASEREVTLTEQGLFLQ